MMHGDQVVADKIASEFIGIGVTFEDPTMGDGAMASMSLTVLAVELNGEICLEVPGKTMN